MSALSAVLYREGKIRVTNLTFIFWDLFYPLGYLLVDSADANGAFRGTGLTGAQQHFEQTHSVGCAASASHGQNKVGGRHRCFPPRSLARSFSVAPASAAPRSRPLSRSRPRPSPSLPRATAPDPARAAGPVSTSTPPRY